MNQYFTSSSRRREWDNCLNEPEWFWDNLLMQRISWSSVTQPNFHTLLSTQLFLICQQCLSKPTVWTQTQTKYWLVIAISSISVWTSFWFQYSWPHYASYQLMSSPNGLSLHIEGTAVWQLLSISEGSLIHYVALRQYIWKVERQPKAELITWRDRYVSAAVKRVASCCDFQYSRPPLYMPIFKDLS